MTESVGRLQHIKAGQLMHRDGSLRDFLSDATDEMKITHVNMNATQE